MGKHDLVMFESPRDGHEMDAGPLPVLLTQWPEEAHHSTNMYINPCQTPWVVSILTLSIEMSPILKDGIYFIINKKSGTALDLSVQDQRSIIGYCRNGGANQKVRSTATPLHYDR